MKHTAYPPLPQPAYVHHERGFVHDIEHRCYTEQQMRDYVDADRTRRPHPDDLAVDRFAAAMKAKLARARAKGRSGWDNPQDCAADHLRQELCAHMRKGDPVDVANYAMMLHQRGESTRARLDPDLVAAINAAPADTTAIEHNGHPVFITRTSLTMDQITDLADRVHEITATVVSIKHLAGEIVLQMPNGSEVPQDLETGQEVCVLYELPPNEKEATRA